MKKTYLFCTKIGWFISLIPSIVLLIISIYYNESSTGLLKLYPLIIILSGIIIFIGMYFFRGVKINFEEIKCIGLFSSKESAVINANKTLYISILPKRKILLELYGANDDFETYAWLKSEEGTQINLFRAKALGNSSTVRKVLSYFDIEAEYIENAIKSENFSADCEKIKLTTETINNQKTFVIYFKETV